MEGVTEEENVHDFGAGLKFMREEEKLARDVYITLGDEFGLQIFRNIQESEETHTTAVYDLLDKYDIPDPAYMADVGEFTNPDLQQIYNDHLKAFVSNLERSGMSYSPQLMDVDAYEVALN